MKCLRVQIAASLTIAITTLSCLAQESPGELFPETLQFKARALGHPLRDKADPQFGSQRYPRYELRAEDVLDISFEFTPEFNQTATVQPDGYITLRGVGDVHVGRVTVPEVTEAIRTAYGKILKDPAIAVVLKEFEKPYFIAAERSDAPASTSCGVTPP